METKDGIIQEIKGYIDSKGNQITKWHVGITDSPSKIFNDFNVNKPDGFWIYITAENNEAALKIRQSLISDGLIADKFETSDAYKIVFAYKRSL